MSREEEFAERLRRIEELTRIGVKEVLTVSELALYLGRSEKTIRNRLGEIPHWKGGDGVVFRKKEILGWLCQVRCAPLSEILKGENVRP